MWSLTTETSGSMRPRRLLFRPTTQHSHWCYCVQACKYCMQDEYNARSTPKAGSIETRRGRSRSTGQSVHSKFQVAFRTSNRMQLGIGYQPLQGQLHHRSWQVPYRCNRRSVELFTCYRGLSPEQLRCYRYHSEDLLSLWPQLQISLWP